MQPFCFDGNSFGTTCLAGLIVGSTFASQLVDKTTGRPSFGMISDYLWK
jgi:hypothetical protein